MARVKLLLPGQFSFSCRIPVRITDLNYGEHVGNDTILSVVHEARVQFLHSLGYTELKFAGAGLIMADAALEFKSELFYGDMIIASVAVGEIAKIGFELYYKLEAERPGNDKLILAALAKTGMICYNYDQQKIVSMPEEATAKLK